MAVLTVMTLISVTVGIMFGTDRVSCHKIALSCVAVCFLLWAVYKNLQTETFEDYGVITFGLVLMVAALTPPLSASRDANIKRASTAMASFGVACTCVSAHYAWVLFTVPDLKPGLQIYLMCGALWWFSAMVWTVTVLFSHVLTLKRCEIDLESQALMESDSIQGRFRLLLTQ